MGEQNRDPAEIEAVESAIYNLVAVWDQDPEDWDYPEGEPDPTIPWAELPDNLDWDVEGNFNKALIQEFAAAAIAALDAHRAPKVRDAVDNYRANVESNVKWGPGELGLLQRTEDASLHELLALVGAGEDQS